MFLMAFCDFVVKYDADVDSPEELTRRILYSIWVKRLKANKPCIVFFGGDSGEGKSLSVIKLLQIFLDIQGLDIKDFFDDVNVYSPFEYPTKLDALLHDKRLKKVNALVVHEARELVKAKNWHSYVNTAIADVNALSRTIKRLLVVVISQFIRDISTDIRYTLNYYCIVKRPKGKLARVYISVMWKDDRDLEKPKLKKRKLSGYLVDKNGRYRRYVPTYLELSMVAKEFKDRFDEADRNSKELMLRSKMDRLLNEMKEDAGLENDKVGGMLKYYLQNPDLISSIGRTLRGKWRLKPEVRAVHDLSAREAEIFELKLHKELEKQKVIS